jgi:hypothetical protein
MFFSGSKSPGLIILEHELFDMSVQAFIDAYPLIKSNNWTFASLTGIFNGGDTYQNAHNSSSNVTFAGGILAGQNSTPIPSSPSMQSSSSRSVFCIVFVLPFIYTTFSGSPALTSSGTKLASSTAPAVKSSSSRHVNEIPLNIVYAILAIALMTTFTSVA